MRLTLIPKRQVTETTPVNSATTLFFNTAAIFVYNHTPNSEESICWNLWIIKFVLIYRCEEEEEEEEENVNRMFSKLVHCAVIYCLTTPKNYG